MRKEGKEEKKKKDRLRAIDRSREDGSLFMLYRIICGDR